MTTKRHARKGVVCFYCRAPKRLVRLCKACRHYVCGWEDCPGSPCPGSTPLARRG